MPQDYRKKLPETEPQELTLEDFEERARDRYGVPKGLWEGLKSTESGGDVNAVSPTGVRGRFQVTKATAGNYNLDRDDPFHQAVAAAKNLREGYDKHAHLKDDNQRWLAAAGYYYGGPDAVKPDGTLSAASKDQLSNPQEYVTSIAQRWKEYNDSQGTQASQEQMQFDLNEPKTKQASSESLLMPRQSRALMAKERKLASDETARQKATPQIARMVQDFEALKSEGSVDAARSVAAKIKAQYGRWMEVGEGDGWPYVKSKIRGWNPVQPLSSPITTPSLEDQQAEFASRPLLEQWSDRALDALARGGGDISKMARQTAGAGLGLAQGLAGGDFRPVDLPAWRQAEEERMRALEERRIRRPSSFVTDVAEGTIEAIPAAAGAIGGTMLTGGGAPAAMAIGAGMGAAGADWSNPQRAAAQTALGAVAPVVGGKAGAAAGRAVASRLAGPTAQAAARAGGELVGGGAGNVLASGAEQLAFEGRVDPRELAKQGIIGAALNAPGAIGAAGRPAILPRSPISGADPAILESAARAQAPVPMIPRTADAGQKIVADFGNRLAQIERMIPQGPERQAAIEQAREEFALRRRGVMAAPKVEPRPVATSVENIPVAKTPAGIQIIRQDEPVPPRQPGQRQIPMEIENPDGTTETVLVIAEGRVNETKLRPMVESAIRSPQPRVSNPPAQPISVAQGAESGPPPLLQQMQQPAPARRQPAPIQFTQLPRSGLKTPRTPGGAIEAQPSSLPSRKLLGPGRPEDVPTEALSRPRTDALTTQRLPAPVYPDAPETQEMPALRQWMARENAPTGELPAVPLQRRTALVPRQPQPLSTRRTAQVPPIVTNEPTNRITSGEGAELQRRVSRPLEGQPIEMPGRRLPAAPSRPAGGRFPQSLAGRMYPEFPGDRRAIVGEGRRVGAEIEAGRGEKGQFGKIAQQMFKSTSGEVPHGQDAFFHDPSVKGALGLSRDAEMGEVRTELKKEFARSMGVKADEVSLTQISPDVWKRWARQKGLRGDAVAKMNTAIDRYQKGVISDIEKTAAAKAEQPSERVGAVPETPKVADLGQPGRDLAEATETGRKIQHTALGEVTESSNQKGVPRGKIAVVDTEGKEHTIQNPRTKGNRQAAFVKTAPKAKSLSQFVKEAGGIKPSTANRGELSYASRKEYNRVAIINRRGVPADEMRRQAMEAGYGKWDTESEFLSALRDDVEGRKVFSAEREIDYEAEYRKSLSSDDQGELESFDKFLNDKDAVDAYDRVSRGDISGDAIKKLRQFSKQYGLADDSIEAIINEGRGVGDRSSQSQASEVLPNDARSKGQAPSQKVAQPNIVQQMAKLARTPRSPVEVSKLRAEFPQMSKADFDAEMIKLNEEGRIALHRHDYPSSLSESDRAKMVKIGNDYFTAATIRPREGTVMGFGLGGLQGMFKGRKAPSANPSKQDIESAGLGQALGNIAKGTGNEMRTLMTLLDFGAPGAQGIWFTMSHPAKGAASMAKMFRSLKQSQSDAIDAEIAFHPLRALGEKAGLYLATSQRLKGNKSGGEEAYRGFLAEKPVFRHFERTYRTYLDTLRMSVWESYVKSLQRQGITWESNPKAYRDAASFINIGSGRGQLKKGGMLDKASDIMGAVAFAPRNLVANFQLIDPIRYARMEPAARRLALKDSLTTIGTMIGTALLLRQAGVSVGLNPESDDFMVARAGDTRYDLTFGKKSQVQFLARLVAGAYRQATGEGNLPQKDPLGVAKKFAESKASPLLSTAFMLGEGKTYEGKQIADMSKGEIAWETGPWPILMKDLIDVYQKEGKMGVAKTLPAVLGARVNTYPDRAKAAFLDVPPEVRAEQKQAGKTRPFLSPRRAQSSTEKDETPGQFATRKAQANEWNAKYGSQLVGSDVYKSATKEEKALALDYLKEQVARQSGKERPSLHLFNPGQIFQTVRESERQKRRKAEGAM